ncbi:unnamed protein product [Hermetia illucens]|uniref:Uncharacterized protein n=1 Tax=Hermetia illucens TaxID=343691 RepID=A0A7R8UC36_HERIL|nr:uncharacterized protein LOC119661464 [Hermetia illucens]CAD7077194.1 unnamed protein product [Hermetia illucens]
MILFSFLANLLLLPSVFCQSLINTVHKTPAAEVKINDLWCYTCETMEDGEACVDFLSNRSSLAKQCKADEYICMVKRFSYTTSTENSTSSPKMWSLERKCAVNCESGCIIIGERTKLYACTSCCNKSLCNTGTGSAASLLNSLNINILNSLFLVPILRYLF